MKLKILLLVAAIAVTGGSVTVLLVQSSQHRQKIISPEYQQLPTAMSNYSKTFKLNTSPPIWQESKGATNGHSAN
jgi:hypothetical protein